MKIGTSGWGSFLCKINNVAVFYASSSGRLLGCRVKLLMFHPAAGERQQMGVDRQMHEHDKRLQPHWSLLCEMTATVRLEANMEFGNSERSPLLTLW